MSSRNEDTDKPKTETDTETGGGDEAKDDNGLNLNTYIYPTFTSVYPTAITLQCNQSITGAEE